MNGGMSRGPFLLEPAFQRYAWGDPTFIGSVYGHATTGPLAEAWLGAHPALPCEARPLHPTVTPEAMSLAAFIAASAPSVLGDAVHERFGELPFLVKILAAARPLSVQVHPHRAQAEAGFRRENAAGIPLTAAARNYKDPNPKPELLVALTPFSALVGFRSPAAITEVLADARELAELLPTWRPQSPDDDPDAVAALVEAYFGLDEHDRSAALLPWLERLAGRSPAAGSQDAWVLACHRLFGTASVDGDVRPDPGVFVVALLNLVALAPGEAIFLPAGVPHAYLQGAGVEVMAASDNVLRAGLTPKNIDVAELLAVVDFRSQVPRVLRPEPTPDGAAVYPTSAEEFEVRRYDLGPAPATPTSWRTRGPEVLLWIPGRDALAPSAQEERPTLSLRCDGHPATLTPGGSCFLPDGCLVELAGTTGPGAVFVTSVPDPRAPVLFRGREPVKLAFGTSGLRGLVTDITDLEAYVNTRGFLDVLLSRGDLSPRGPVALAGDLRPSTDCPSRSILRAVAAAVRDAGFTLVYGGRIPTPALAAYAFEHGWPSIMVTGSHIPFDRNGIKFNKPGGEVLKSDEGPIVASVERTRRALYREEPARSRFGDDGMFREPPPPLPPEDPAVRQHYVARYLRFFPPRALAGLRVVLFEHTAVGREVVAEVLRGLGAEVHAVGRSDTFVAIDTEAIPEARLAEMQRLAADAVARFGPFDALVSTDGDSDRPMVFGAAPDGRLTFVGGDALGILVADYLDTDALAVPVTATDAVERHFAGRAVTSVRTRVGSPYVIDAMTTRAGLRKVGWEANGGFLTFSRLERDGRSLAPLPTRDALLPISAVLHAVRQRGKPLATLAAELPPRYARAGLLDEIPVLKCRALAAHYDPGVAELRSAAFSASGGALSVRWTDHQGETREAEARLGQRLRDIHALVSGDFHADRGFGPLLHIDYLDGLRLTFEGGEVAHVRASGNAPQLRIYALASSDARAREIVELALAADGLLATMLARV